MGLQEWYLVGASRVGARRVGDAADQNLPRLQTCRWQLLKQRLNTAEQRRYLALHLHRTSYRLLRLAPGHRPLSIRWNVSDLVYDSSIDRVVSHG